MKYLSFLMLCVIVVQHQARAAGCTWNTGPVGDICKMHPLVHLQNDYKNENGKRRCVARLRYQWNIFAAFGLARSTWIYSGTCHSGYNRFYTQHEEWQWCCYQRRLQQQLPAKVNTDVSLDTIESVRSRQINPPAHLRGAVDE